MTFEEFKKCVSVLGFSEPLSEPLSEIFTEFNQKCRKLGGITTKLESLMVLTHLISESNSFTIKSDPACSQANQTHLCEKYRKEDKCPPNNTYYRRGFIGLKYCYNYREVSKELYGDQRLVLNPDIVSQNNSVAMDTALTYWKIKVHNKSNIKSLIESGLFGYTTDLLSREECVNDITKAKKKWNYFNECLKKSGNQNFKRSEGGCYSIIKYQQTSDSSSITTTLITCSVVSFILLILILTLLFVFMRRAKKSRQLNSNKAITIDNIYDDISINNSLDLNKDYDYASVGGDDYECMYNYEKISIKSANNEIYLSMNAIK